MRNLATYLSFIFFEIIWTREFFSNFSINYASQILD